MAGPLVGDVETCADPIELGDAHGAVHFGRQDGLERMRWGMGIRWQ